MSITKTSYKKLNDQKLDQAAKQQSQVVHREVIKLLDILIEVNRRRSYADHGYSSLFYYITKYLGFSSAQAGVYNSVIQSKVLELEPAKKMLSSGEVSLSSLSLLGNSIRKSEVKVSEAKKEKMLMSIKGKSREQVKVELSDKLSLKERPKGARLTINSKLKSDLERIKKKLKTPAMTDEAVVQYLVNKELNSGKSIQTNKSITPKTRAVLLRRAKHRCQFVTRVGKRCEATDHLEVEHIKPRAKGGGHNPENLKILCWAHNQRSAVKEFGIKK